MDAYSNDDASGLGYKSLFIKYGFFPVPLYNHIDTYRTNSNISTQIGKQNLEYLQLADVIFFNGGDQARHARCWLNDDGTYNALMSVAYQRAKLNQVILAGTSAGTMIMSNQTFG
jgi:cyanophycinase-like exopeptidase